MRFTSLAAILTGAACAWGINSFTRRGSPTAPDTAWLHQALPTWVSLLLSISLVVVGIRGSRSRLYDINIPQYALASHPDLHAAAWIRQNTSQEDIFLVNSFFAYENTLVVGSDAGWWLPILAGRSTSLPPLTYGVEKGPGLDYRAWVNQLPAEIFQKSISNPDVLKLLNQRGYDYVYIGQQQGSVNFSGVFLDLGQLLADPHFIPVYHQDRVWIFQINYQPENFP